MSWNSRASAPSRLASILARTLSMVAMPESSNPVGRSLAAPPAIATSQTRRCRSTRAKLYEAAQGFARRRISDAIDERGPVAALEGSNDRMRPRIVDAVQREIIAEADELNLQSAYIWTSIALVQADTVRNRRRRHPEADTRAIERLPGKALPRIDFAVRRDVGMGEDALGRNLVTSAEVAAEFADGRDLHLRIRWQPTRMAGIDDLDPERTRVEVGLPSPGGSSGMPGAPVLGDELQDLAVLAHEIMAGHFC